MKISFWGALGGALMISLTASAAPADEPFRKKVIAASWDLGVFSLADILANEAAFADVPFDGARLFPNGAMRPDGTPLDVNWPLRGPAWVENAFDGLVPDLKRVTALRAFRHSFIGFALSSGKEDRLDFRDDAAWRRASGNLRLLARLARKGGCRGLWLDPEDYRKGGQFYRKDSDPPLEETRRLSRRRGHEIAEAIFGEFPEATVLSCWLWSARRSYLHDADPRESAREAGDLWIAFLDGMLDGISPNGRLVDGDEFSYNYSPFVRTGQTYADRMDENRACIAFVSPENRSKFRAHVLMGCALYLDRYTNAEGNFYRSNPVSGSRLLRFDENLSAALRAADEYVWLWAESHAWIDWKTHGKPARPVTFDEHRTWEDGLPGIYDSLMAAVDPKRFLSERFPQLRGCATCTNLIRNASWTVDGKPSVGKVARLKDVQRADRYVFEYVARGETPGATAAFYSEKGLQWEVPTVHLRGAGTRRCLVKVLPDTTALAFRGYSTGEKGVTFETVGAYRLPREDGYFENGDWSLQVGGKSFWFTLDGGDRASEHMVLWGEGVPAPAKVTRAADGRVTLADAQGRSLSFVPTAADEMTCTLGGKTRTTGIARRLPSLPKAPNPGKLSFGEPIDLLKGGLDAFLPADGDAGSWSFAKGVLSHGGKPGTLRTKRADFSDFKLSYEVRVGKGGDAGVYLKGVYEILSVDSFGRPLDRRSMAALNGRLAPTREFELAPGSWQRVEVIFASRHLTVILNRHKVIANQPVRGVTGGALEVDEFAPGPILLRGGKGDVAYRNMILTPVLKAK